MESLPVQNGKDFDLYLHYEALNFFQKKLHRNALFFKKLFKNENVGFTYDCLLECTLEEKRELVLVLKESLNRGSQKGIKELDGFEDKERLLIEKLQGDIELTLIIEKIKQKISDITKK